MKFSLFVILVCSGLFFISCEKAPVSADDFLSSYVNRSFKGVGVEEYEAFFAPPLLDRVRAMDKEQLYKFLEVGDVQMRSYRPLVTRCRDEKCHITYEIRYYQGQNAQKNEFSVSVKKAAVLVKVKNEWKISEVQNVKTFIESNEMLDIPSEN